jgi:hypothetical protein
MTGFLIIISICYLGLLGCGIVMLIDTKEKRGKK